MKLQPLEPRRMRRPRGAYGWVDMRAVTEGHLERLGTQTALTYLFLCTVGDTAGLSFWATSAWRASSAWIVERFRPLSTRLSPPT